MNALTIYCAASDAIPDHYRSAAARLGSALAERGIDLVFGGGSVGLMGETARAVRNAGGRTIGIITRTLLHMEQGDEACDELIIVETMRERKKLLIERGDAFLVLPGGIGTYEEFFEVLVARQLGEHDHPIGLVNVRGYYDPLIELIAHGEREGFIRPSFHELVVIHDDPIAALDELVEQTAVTVDA